MIKKRLEDILVELCNIHQNQLQECLKEQKNTGKQLSIILLERGLISRADLVRALAAQAELPFVEQITEQMADIELMRKIPLKFLRQNLVIPVIIQEQKTIVTANPNDLQPLDDVALLVAGKVVYAVASEGVISEAINRYYPLEASKDMMDELQDDGSDNSFDFDDTNIEEKDIMEMANEAPIVKLVNHTIYQAVKESASDIHIEPFEKELRIRYRIDGNMYQRMVPPKRYQSAIVSRIKIMSDLNIAEKRIPQDGRIQIKVADKAIDLRVSVLPCNYGERVVMRLLDKTKGVQDLDAYNFSERDAQIIRKTIMRPNGIVLVSGPTGSGKTSTLYAVLNKLNEPDVNIITVEDPVEYTINGISQVQVNVKAGLTFASALRSILRQDPDICLIGEIRDGETAGIATQAALTGHLVLSTIHTNSAPATITRLIDMGIEPFLIASSVICVISQRLVRRLCSKCKVSYKPEASFLQKMEISAKQAAGVSFYKPGGCDDCLKTGYRGRMPLFEIMEISDEIAKLIMQRVDATVIREQAVKEGMSLLGQDGMRAVSQGLTSLEEVMAVAYISDVV
jgi:general secretion pathway protein E